MQEKGSLHNKGKARMSSSTSRRQFLGRTAAIGAGFGVWSGRSPVLRANESALQGLSAACIGVGGKGSSDTSHIAEQGVNICLLYTSPSPRDSDSSRMPSSA